MFPVSKQNDLNLNIVIDRVFRGFKKEAIVRLDQSFDLTEEQRSEIINIIYRFNSDDSVTGPNVLKNKLLLVLTGRAEEIISQEEESLASVSLEDRIQVANLGCTMDSVLIDKAFKLNHLLSNKDLSNIIFSGFDSRTLSRCSSVCKLFNEIKTDMEIKLNNILSLNDIGIEVFSNFDKKTFIKCSSVCKLWNEIANNHELLCKFIPEFSVLCKFNTGKKCLNKHAIAEFDEISVRFKELIEKTEPLGTFSFICIFPYNPDNNFIIERKAVKTNKDGSNVIEDCSMDHMDFCILMKPITNKTSRSSAHRSSAHPYFFKVEIEGNISDEQQLQIIRKTQSILQQHDYPGTYQIREKCQEFVNSFWKREFIIGGVVAIFAVGLSATFWFNWENR